MATITEQDRLNALADNVLMREREVFGYQMNIDNYTTMLLTLPGDEWPAGLLQYKLTPVASLPESMSDADVQTVNDYQYRDRITGLLRTERAEQGKAQRVHDALVAQIPAGELDALIAAAVVRAAPAPA